VLYTINVLTAKTLPEPWYSMNAVLGVQYKTPDIHPLPEKPDPDVMMAAQEARHVLGTLLGEDKVDASDAVTVYCDDLGCVHARRAGTDAEPEVSLSHLTWRKVGSYYLRVELQYESGSNWTEMLAAALPRGRRIANLLLLRRCGRCRYFDRDGAREWRSKVTHAFGGISGGINVGMSESMNDDIVKIEAANHRAPDFQRGEMGYCPKQDCGLSASLMACGAFKRRWF